MTKIWSSRHLPKFSRIRSISPERNLTIFNLVGCDQKLTIFSQVGPDRQI